MADKSFGVKELNLLNASGTPTITSPNNLNLNANTVAISTSVTIGQNLTVSSNAGIASLNVTGIATVVNFNATGISTIVQPSNANPHSLWDVVNNSGSSYRFTGPGVVSTDDNPNIYLVRGQRYIFKVNASSHPFYIKTEAGTGTGNQYTDGVTGNGAQSGNIIFNVQHDAPPQLKYQCSAHGSMVGNIYIVGNSEVISGVSTFSNGINVGGGTLDVATQIRKSSGTLDYLSATHTFANVAGSTEYFRFASSGQLGIAGANYGTSGQVLTSQGASSAVQWATPTPGITMIDQYFLSVQKTANGNAAIALDSDFIRVSGNVPGAGHIGTGMTKNGEIFSFPSTGIYSIHFRACVMINSSSTGNRYAQNPIFITTDNSSYQNRAMGLDGVENISGESFGNPIANFIFDVTNTSTCKCKFNIQSGESGWTAYVRTNRLDNVVTFTRLGDT